MRGTELVNRQAYLDRALMFRDTDLIKVVTGVRRCGKSSLLGLVRNKIASEGVEGREIVSLNLESKACPVTIEDELYDYFRDRVSPEGRTYMFLDEPQRIEGWQTAVNAMRVDFVAVKDGRTVYLQVTDEMLSEATRERELKPLRSIRDSYEKFVVVRQGKYEPDIGGIKILPARDFFLGSLL